MGYTTKREDKPYPAHHFNSEETGKVIREYTYRFVTTRFKPYDYATEHLVIWRNQFPVLDNTRMYDVEELQYILKTYSDRTKIENAEQDKTIKSQRHIHLLKLKRFDSLDNIEGGK